jgi:hypothetical protein
MPSAAQPRHATQDPTEVEVGVARKGIVTTIDMSGPFFTKDPKKTFRQNVRDMMDQLAEAGESDVKAQLQAGAGSRAVISHGVSPDRVSEHVVGRTKSISMKRWALTAVVSVNNIGLSRQGGIALMAAASRLESQTHAFRKTAARARKVSKMNDLTKGL